VRGPHPRAMTSRIAPSASCIMVLPLSPFQTARAGRTTGGGGDQCPVSTPRSAEAQGRHRHLTSTSAYNAKVRLRPQPPPPPPPPPTDGAAMATSLTASPSPHETVPTPPQDQRPPAGVGSKKHVWVARRTRGTMRRILASLHLVRPTQRGRHRPPPGNILPGDRVYCKPTCWRTATPSSPRCFRRSSRLLGLTLLVARPSTSIRSRSAAARGDPMEQRAAHSLSCQPPYGDSSALCAS